MERVEQDVAFGKQFTVFDAVGGMAFFTKLTAGFYRRVAADPVLLSLYPTPEDLGPAERRMCLFLAQYWGGPGTYSEERGHPRLRMRHNPFVIGPTERDHWMVAMTAALDDTATDMDMDQALRVRFDEYFAMSSEAMRNSD